MFILDACTFTMHLDKYVSFPIILYYYMNKYKHYFEKQRYCRFFFFISTYLQFSPLVFHFRAGTRRRSNGERKHESVHNSITARVMVNTQDMDVVSAFQYSWGCVYFEQDDFSLHEAIYYYPKPDLVVYFQRT